MKPYCHNISGCTLQKSTHAFQCMLHSHNCKQSMQKQPTVCWIHQRAHTGKTLPCSRAAHYCCCCTPPSTSATCTYCCPPLMPKTLGKGYSSSDTGPGCLSADTLHATQRGIHLCPPPLAPACSTCIHLVLHLLLLLLPPPPADNGLKPASHLQVQALVLPTPCTPSAAAGTVAAGTALAAAAAAAAPPHTPHS